MDTMILYAPMFVLAAAWLLDACLGDPEKMPHPVRLIGWCSTRLEVLLRGRSWSLRLSGVMIGVLVPAGTFAATYAIVQAALWLNVWFGFAVQAVLIYWCLSTRCLGREALLICMPLAAGDIASARSRLGRIVGRDTDVLDEAGVVRATLESVSESSVDGIIAPLVWAALGGAPLAMAYKAVNTLDSMIGYTNDRYRDFGWFSARLDDAANWIPARFSLLLVPLATLCVQPSRALRSFVIGLRDRGNSPSPNSGHPEACFAGALGIQLGGEATYGGSIALKPLIGDAERPGTPADIRSAIALMWLTSAWALVLSLIIAYAAAFR